MTLIENFKFIYYGTFIIELEAKSRQNNIIIYGFPENYDQEAETLDEVNDFIYNYLDLDPGQMYIEKAHRLGKLSKYYNSRIQGKPKRPLLISFKYTSEVDIAMKCAKKLRSTSYSMDRDYPPEIVAARKKLWPELKRLRKTPYCNAKMIYPAAIVVNGVVKFDEFPYWDSMIKSGTMYKPNYIWGSPILSQREGAEHLPGAAATSTQQNQNNNPRQTIPSTGLQRVFPWAQAVNQKSQSESENRSTNTVQNENTSQSQLSQSLFNSNKTPVVHTISSNTHLSESQMSTQPNNVFTKPRQISTVRKSRARSMSVGQADDTVTGQRGRARKPSANKNRQRDNSAQSVKRTQRKSTPAPPISNVNAGNPGITSQGQQN